MRRFLDWLDDFIEYHCRDFLNVGMAIMLVCGVAVILGFFAKCFGVIE